MSALLLNDFQVFTQRDEETVTTYRSLAIFWCCLHCQKAQLEKKPFASYSYRHQVTRVSFC